MAYKYSFFNDYSEGAHPRILESLRRGNLVQERGYGQDAVSADAMTLMRAALKNEHVDIHFVSGGTQANIVVLASLLKPYESVIAAESSHINLHEAGAIEATGHKINCIATQDGKLTPEKIAAVVAQHTDEHMVKPGAVFISQATEAGTIYKKKELEAISAMCKDKKLYLYVDGARLGASLASIESDLQLSDLPSLVDVFYIGGTKNGALLGEAIVVCAAPVKENFRFYIKQHGALLAKGRTISAQFAELFTGGLFLELARHANGMAQLMAEGIKDCGYAFLTQSSTNQIFPILPNSVIEKLEKDYGFYMWTQTKSDHSAIRLVTSWATTKEAIDMFLHDLRKFSHTAS